MQSILYNFYQINFFNMFHKKIFLFSIILLQTCFFFNFNVKVSAVNILQYTLNGQSIESIDLNTANQESVAIDLDFEEPTKVDLKILDSNGNVIKNLYESDSVNNPTAKNWDGKDDKNNFVNSGVYTISLAYGLNQDISKSIIITNPNSIISADASLSNLFVSQGFISPKFNSKTLNYTVQLLAGSTSTPEVQIELASSQAKATITKATDITSVDNIEKRTTEINIVAENGDVQTYAVIFNVNPLSIAQRNVQITEFMPNPDGEDSSGEYIKLQNLTSSDINLKNWKIQDLNISGNPNSHTFASDFILPANGNITICRPSQIPGMICDYQWSQMNLSNDFDSISLLNKENLLVDQVSYNLDHVLSGFYVMVDGNGVLSLQNKNQGSSSSTESAINLITYNLNGQNISNIVFNPWEDEVAQIDLLFNRNTDVDIKILDSNGNIVRDLYKSDSVSNPAPKNWDGKDNTSKTLSPGTYTIQLSYSGQINTQKSVTLNNFSNSSSSSSSSNNQSSSSNSSNTSSSSSSSLEFSSSSDSSSSNSSDNSTNSSSFSSEQNSSETTSSQNYPQNDLELNLEIDKKEATTAQIVNFTLKISNLQEVLVKDSSLDFYLPKDLEFLKATYLNGKSLELIKDNSSNFSLAKNITENESDFNKISFNLSDLKARENQEIKIQALVVTNKNLELSSFANLNSKLDQNLENNVSKVNFNLVASSGSNSATKSGKNLNTNSNYARSNIPGLVRTGGSDSSDSILGYFLIFSGLSLWFISRPFLINQRNF